MSAFRHAVHYRETLHIYSQLDAAITETPSRTAQQVRDGMKSCEVQMNLSRKAKGRGILMCLTANGCPVAGDTALHAESPGLRCCPEERLF